MSLEAEGAWPAQDFTSQAWVEGEPDVDDYRSWSTIVVVPPSRSLCGRPVKVKASGSDARGNCDVKERSFRPNCCPAVENITAAPEARCFGNGATRRVTVSFDVVRHDLAGLLTATVALRREGSAVPFRSDPISFEESEGERKHVSVSIPVEAPFSGEVYLYQGTVELTPPAPSFCEKEDWPIGEGVRVNACDCSPLAGELRLVNPDDHDAPVEERDGPAGKCVDLARVKVLAPDPPNGDTALVWTHATPIPGERAAIVDLPEGGEVTVRADIGDRCRTSLERTIRRCGAEGTGKPEEGGDDGGNGGGPSRPTVPWCALLGLGAIFLIAFGLALFAVSFCLLNYADYILAALVALGAVSAGSTTAAALAIVIVLVVFVLMGSAIAVAGNILFILWLLTCGSCRTNCSLLNNIHWLLVLLISLWGLISLVAGIVGGGRPCWIGWILGVVDFGFLDVLVLYYGAAVGCWPWAGWVPRFLRLRIPDPMRFICGK